MDRDEIKLLYLKLLRQWAALNGVALTKETLEYIDQLDVNGYPVSSFPAYTQLIEWGNSTANVDADKLYKLAYQQKQEVEATQNRQETNLKNMASAYNYPFNDLDLSDYEGSMAKIDKWIKQSQGLNQLKQTELNQQKAQQTAQNQGMAWQQMVANQQQVAPDVEREKLRTQFESERESVLTSLKQDPNKNWMQIYETMKTRNPYVAPPTSQEGYSQKYWKDYLDYSGKSSQADAMLKAGLDENGTPIIPGTPKEQQLRWTASLAPAALKLAEQYDLNAFGKNVVDAAKRVGVSALTMNSWAQQMAQTGRISSAELGQKFYAGITPPDIVNQAAQEAGSLSGEPSVGGTQGWYIDPSIAQRAAAEKYKKEMFASVSPFVQSGKWGGELITPTMQQLSGASNTILGRVQGYASDYRSGGKGLGSSWEDVVGQMQAMLPQSWSLGNRWRASRQ